MSNTTYILGAGASANSIPVILRMENSINKMIEYLCSDKSFILDHNPFFENLGIDLENLNSDKLSKFVSSLRKLKEDCQREITIDTHANILYRNGNWKEYDLLKLNLTSFFTLQQMITKVDPRYSHFLTSILNSNNEIPETIKILSWNYDTQLEMAYGKIIKSDDIYSVLDKMKIHSKFLAVSHSNTNPNIFKLNGSIFYYYANGFRKFYLNSGLTENLNQSNLERLIDNHNNYFDLISKEKMDYSSALSYAFEEEKKEDQYIHKVKESTLETTKLAIIGYSFPHLNYKTDLEIISNMKSLKDILVVTKDSDIMNRKLKNIKNDTKMSFNFDITTETNYFPTPTEI